MGIRILIADDHTILRSGISALLKSEPGLDVIGEASNGKEVLALAPSLQPDVILMDINMDDMSGLEVTRWLKQNHPAIHVLILTIHMEKEILQEAIRNGAYGYLPKHAEKTELINAIYAIYRGELYVHSTLTRLLLNNTPKEDNSSNKPVSLLTKRELEIVKLVANGHSNAQVASSLSISVRTVEFHRKNIMYKLNLYNRVELVQYAKKNGLI